MRMLGATFIGCVVACGDVAPQPAPDGSPLDGAIESGAVCSPSSSPMPQATCDFRWGNGDLQQPQAVARDSAGDTLIVGGFGGTLTFGANTLVGPATSIMNCLPDDGCADQAFAALLSAACEPQWAVALDGYTAWNVAGLPGDRFAIVDSRNLDAPYSTNLIALDALGHTVWSKHFIATPPSATTSGTVALWMASDHAGNIFLAGYIVGSIDFGGGTLSSNPQGTDQLGVLLRLDADGNFVFNSTFALSAGAIEGWSPIGPLSVDDAGQVWLLGSLVSGSINFGGTVFEAVVDASANTFLGYVARLSASDGHYLGGASFDGVQMVGVVSDPCTGRTTVVGDATAGVDFGSGPIGQAAGFILQLDGDGNPIWNQASPGTYWSVGLDGHANVIAAGSQSVADAAISPTNVVLNGYDLAGNTRYAFSWPTSSTSNGWAGTSGANPSGVTVGADGSIVVLGGLGSYTTINFGLGFLPEEIDGGVNTGWTDGFFVRFR